MTDHSGAVPEEGRDAIPDGAVDGTGDERAADDERARRRRPGRRGNLLTALAVLLAIIAVAVNVIHVPYVILKPGPATNTLGKLNGKEIVSISGAKTYPTSGSLDFTTVTMSGGPAYPVTVMNWLTAKFFDDHAEIDPESDWFPKGVTSQQVQQESTAQMTDAQQTATALALRKAGYPVPEDVTIGMIDTSGKYPAQKYFKIDDQLVSLNGSKITDLASVHAAMDKVKPGSTVVVVVVRGGKTMTLQVPTADVQGRAVFGIQLNPIYHPKQQVTVSVGDVGGPSAGLMFALTIYDKLTPGALTGGKRIAGTGTIDEAGDVGPIGGIRQKMVGATGVGAKFFLAPAGDCSEVVGHIPDGLTVIKVDSFDQARADVEKIAAGTTTGFPACTK